MLVFMFPVKEFVASHICDIRSWKCLYILNFFSSILCLQKKQLKCSISLCRRPSHLIILLVQCRLPCHAMTCLANERITKKTINILYIFMRKLCVAIGKQVERWAAVGINDLSFSPIINYDQIIFGMQAEIKMIYE